MTHIFRSKTTPSWFFSSKLHRWGHINQLFALWPFVLKSYLHVYVNFSLKIEWHKCLAIFLKALELFAMLFLCTSFFFCTLSFQQNFIFCKQVQRQMISKQSVKKKITVKIKSGFFSISAPVDLCAQTYVN